MPRRSRGGSEAEPVPKVSIIDVDKQGRMGEGGGGGALCGRPSALSGTLAQSPGCSLTYRSRGANCGAGRQRDVGFGQGTAVPWHPGEAQGDGWMGLLVPGGTGCVGGGRPLRAGHSRRPLAGQSESNRVKVLGCGRSPVGSPRSGTGLPSPRLWWTGRQRHARPWESRSVKACQTIFLKNILKSIGRLSAEIRRNPTIEFLKNKTGGFTICD